MAYADYRAHAGSYAVSGLSRRAGVTQLVESLPSKQMVAGSSPVSRSTA